MFSSMQLPTNLYFLPTRLLTGGHSSNRTLPFGMKARTVLAIAAMAMNARRVFFRPSLFWNSQIRGAANASERPRMVKLT